MDDKVDPVLVPKRQVSSGAELPVVGLGTFGSDKYSPADVAAAVRDAAAVGYRHFDCASVYGNEREVGEALRDVMAAGVAREELWITSKLWNDMHGGDDVVRSCEQSLSDLQLDYLDLYLIHWPFPNFHPPECSVDSRSPDAQPYVHENYMKTWRRLEELVSSGLVRHIGTSNMTVPKLELLLRDTAIMPTANEMELHPHFQQPALFDWCVAHDILPIGYCPLGSPSRPARDRTPADTSDLEDPVVVDIAAAHDLSPADICIQWAVQRGQVPIPFSVRREQYLATLRALAAAPLTDEEMAHLAGIDRGCRLIKGQVFLWKDGQTWEDLWDLDGTITPP